MNPDRLARLRQALDAADLGALALLPGPNLRYLTGLDFHLHERPMVALFLPEGPPHLVLPDLERVQAEERFPQAVLHTYGEAPAARRQAFAEAAKATGLAGRRVGVEPFRMRFAELWLLEEAAPTATFVDAGPALEDLRLRKDAAEAEAHRRAVAIAEAALEAALPLVREGMTEKELAGELVLQLLRAGSEPTMPFSPIVAFGENSALPHATPTDRPLQPGDLVLIDWGATANGYFSDLTRVFAFGEVAEELRRIHQVVLEANEAGRAAARPGVPCGQVDRAARAVIEAAGYGPQFLHRTGHGLGLEIHEPPYLRADNPAPLEPGMVFTVEPGIYLPGVGGVRIEDDLLLTDQGAETLSGLPRDLRTLG